jgi:hypothetical protein
VSAQETKAIHDMSREEVATALPKLREEAVKADAKVQAAMQRLADTIDIPTFVEVHEDHIVVDVRGRDRALRFMSRLRIPIEHVLRAEADPNIEWAVWRGWRVPNVHVPGVRFYDMHGHRDKTIVIWLKDETYDRLIVEVEVPTEVVAKINDAVESAARN